MPLDTSYSIDWEPGSVLLDEFIIERILGHGGMGKVYLVKSTVPGGEVFAVKTLLDSSLKNDTQRRLILRELRTWIDLPDHPNITACRFFRTIGDRLAIFSEYIPNGSLKDWIKQ
ncbi:protein kinase, partial [bacterium]|nr:protein kinase [candidate division CSSED10-310 bacterium]